MFFARGHPALTALIGAAVLVMGLLAQAVVLTAAGGAVLAWAAAAAIASSRDRGIIGGKGSGAAL